MNRRITKMMLDNQAAYITRLLKCKLNEGYHIEEYMGQWRLCKTVNNKGAATNVSMLMSKKELHNFNQGMISGIEWANTQGVNVL